jgi:hypothetical protein
MDLRLYRLIAWHVLEGACRLKVITISEGFSRFRGRFDHSGEVPSQIQVEERHLLGLTDMCHEFRRLDRSFRGF